MKSFKFLVCAILVFPTLTYGEGGESGNGGELKLLCEVKIEEAKKFGLQLLRSVDIDKFKTQDISEKAKEIFTKHHADYITEYVFYQTLKKSEIRAVKEIELEEKQEGEVVIQHPDAAAYRGENSRIEVKIDSCIQQNKLVLTQLLLHETGHLLPSWNGKDYYDEKYETELWEIAHAIPLSLPKASLASLAPNDAPREELDWTEERQTKKDIEDAKKASDEEYEEWLNKLEAADPAYGKYLRPGNFPHSETTKNYDLLRDQRRAILNRFSQRVSQLQPDENGIFRIQIHLGHSESFRSANAFGERSASGKGVDTFGLSDAYTRAVIAAYEPHSGLKYVSQSQVLTYAYSQHVSQLDGQSYNKGSTDLILFLVPDPESDAKVELIKAQSFESFEALLSEVRRAVSTRLVEDELYIRYLISQIGKDASLEKIRIKLEENQGVFSTLELAFRQMDLEEFKASLPGNEKAKLDHLRKAINLTQTRIKAAQHDPDQKKKLEEWLEELKTLLKEWE